MVEIKKVKKFFKDIGYSEVSFHYDVDKEPTMALGHYDRYNNSLILNVSVNNLPLEVVDLFFKARLNTKKNASSPKGCFPYVSVNLETGKIESIKIASSDVFSWPEGYFFKGEIKTLRKIAKSAKNNEIGFGGYESILTNCLYKNKERLREIKERIDNITKEKPLNDLIKEAGLNEDESKALYAAQIYSQLGGEGERFFNSQENEIVDGVFEKLEKVKLPS